MDAQPPKNPHTRAATSDGEVLAVETAVQARAHPPRVSVITACGNDASSIDRCVASVAAQTHPDTEHVVVLMQSRDDTLQHLLDQQQRLTIVFAAAHDNLAQAWNRGLKQASGEVIGFLGPHDRFVHPDVLSQVATAFHDPWLSALYGDRLRANAAPHTNPRIRRTGAFTRQRLRWGWSPPLNTLFVRRLWLERIGGFSAQLKVAADYDATLSLFSQPFFNALYQPEPLVTQASRPWHWQRLQQLLLSPAEELHALRRAELGGLGALFCRYATQFAQTLR